MKKIVGLVIASMMVIFGGTMAMAECETEYQKGYQDGKQQCMENPALCGINVGDGDGKTGLGDVIYNLQILTGGTPTTPSLPSSMVFKSIPGGTFTMGDNNINSARKGITATEHEVTVSSFEIGETEVTTAQFAEFLSGAYKDGLIEIDENGRTREVVGSTMSEYSGKGLYDLSGTRILGGAVGMVIFRYFILVISA